MIKGAIFLGGPGWGMNPDEYWEQQEKRRGNLKQWFETLEKTDLNTFSLIAEAHSQEEAIGSFVRKPLHNQRYGLFLNFNRFQ